MWNGKGLQFSFEIIRLWEQQPEAILETDHYGLWPLAVLMGQNVTAESTFAVAEKIAQAPVPRQEKSHLMGLLGVLVGMRLPEVEVLKALERDHMIEEIWEESSYGEAVQTHARKKMAREMAQLALESRFGKLDEDILAALKPADEATLKALVAHSSTDTLEQVRARLGLS